MTMDYRSLGRSGLKVSVLSLGSWTTLGGSVASGDASPIVHRAFELGINLFDTADVYVKGGAERALGAAIRDLPRGEIVVATKCMGRVGEGPLGRGLSRKHIFDAMDASLKRLGLDYVDLYQFHAPDAETPIEESLRAFEDLVRMGKAHEVLERTQRFLDRRLRVGGVELVEVDVVEPQPLQAGIHRVEDVLARQTAPQRALAHATHALRGHDDLAARQVTDRGAERPLRPALHVHVRGVEQVDPELERAVNDRRSVAGGDAPSQSRPRAEREHRHL